MVNSSNGFHNVVRAGT